MNLRHRLSAALRPMELLAVGILFASLLLAGATRLAGVFTPAVTLTARNPDLSEEVALEGAIRRLDRELTALSARLQGRPLDGRLCLRVASLELRRADLLGLQAYQQPVAIPHRDAGTSTSDYPVWKRQFLRSDPDDTLSRATEAAQAAMQQGLDRSAEQQALLLLASARSALGDSKGEAAALAGLVQRAPSNARLWFRLADAYGRCGRFAQAEVARGKGLALLGGGRGDR